MCMSKHFSPSPIGPALLVKRQCSSFMKCPLRTMSCLVIASSLPTLSKHRTTEYGKSISGYKLHCGQISRSSDSMCQLTHRRFYKI